MLKVSENKVFHDGEKIGWIEGAHIYEASGKKLGYIEDIHVYNEAGHKLAYTHENELAFENGESSVSLEHVNDEVEGTVPLIMKCAIFVLFDY